MIKTLVQIGNIIKNGILEQFNVKRGTNLISLDFNTTDNKIDVYIERELTSDFLVQTGFKGVTRGSGKEYGVILPGDKIKYLGVGDFISTSKFSLFNVYNELKSKQQDTITDQEQEIVEKLEKVISQFYEKKQDEKGKYKLKLKKDNEILKKIKNKAANSPYYLQICIDGIPLWKTYRHHADIKIIENRKCSVCNKGGILEEFDTNQLKFIKFFGKDKLGFYPELSLDNQRKVLPLCPECAESIVLADVYLKDSKLYTTIIKEQKKQLILLVLPEISAWQKFPSNFLKRALFILKEASDVLADWRELNQFEVYAEKIFESSDVKLHILINVYDGQTLKIYSSLTNIPPSRLKQLALSLKKVSIFMGYENTYFSLFNLYKILAGKEFAQSKKAALIKEKFAEVFKNLILGNPIPDIVFIKPGIELVSWQFNKKDRNWIYLVQMIEGFLIIKELMKGQNLFPEGGKEMGDILEDAKKYINQNPVYEGREGELRQGLFLLGYIISEIAAKQSKKGLKDAILNKVQFRGMNKNQILRLVNQTFDYMRIYGLQTQRDLELWGEITEIFDKNLSNWNLTPEEAVYFILSGYAFRTSKAIKLKREQSLNKEEKP